MVAWEFVRFAVSIPVLGQSLVVLWLGVLLVASLVVVAFGECVGSGRGGWCGGMAVGTKR